MQIWRLIVSGNYDAAYNMAIDEAIAIAVGQGYSPCTLRIYGWEAPAVSIGSFQKITDINLEFCKNNNIQVVRRPTGGRAILHGDELTYSFSSRYEEWFSGNLLKTYQKLGEAFQLTFHKIGLPVTMKLDRQSRINLLRSPLCFKSVSYGEITFKNKKLIGSAQKRWKDGFLQQGSIPYSIDYKNIKSVFNITLHSQNAHNQVVEDLGMSGLKDLLLDFKPEEFKNALKSSFEEIFNITFQVSYLLPYEEEIAQHLTTEKYQNQKWTLGTLRNI